MMSQMTFAPAITYPMFLRVGPRTMPGSDGTTYYTILEAILLAGSKYKIDYMCALSGATGVTDYRVRIDVPCLVGGGCGHGHSYIPDNSLGFTGGNTVHVYGSIGDGSPISFTIAGSTGTRMASRVGSVLVDADTSSRVFKIRLRDSTTGPSGMYGCSVLVRKLT